ncbi:MAG: quinone-dependent dihydroorotate dehydrogenase [Pseudomonadota bacterium]
MRVIDRLGLGLLHRIDPEKAHDLALQAMRYGVVPLPGEVTSTRLKTEIAGLKLSNPLGLAAGFDKNARALGSLGNAGFGFVEVGAVTPKPQPGNAKPRLFRLSEDQAVINRFGFNNDGMEQVVTRLQQRPPRGVIGLNLGANKDSTDRAEDYATVLSCCGPHLDFATVNVSSPNTENLRDLQGAEALSALLKGVNDAREMLQRPIPIFLKIAPDLSDTELSEIVDVAKQAKLAGIIATNTTLSREGLRSLQKNEKGGLSGAPLFERSTRVLAKLSQLTESKMTLIGVGGVTTSEDAYAKIRAGAHAVQLYSALVYHGIGLVAQIVSGLDEILTRDGYQSVSDAVGSQRDEWL